MTDEPTLTVPPRRRRFLGFLAVGAALVAALAAREGYRRYAATHISTDDAYVEGTIHTVAARVAGTAARVAVADNQPVRAGETLVEIDPALLAERVREAEAALAAERLRGGEIAARRTAALTRIRAAEAALARARAAREELAAAVAVREAEAAARRAVLEQAERDFARAENLLAKQVIARERHDAARTALETARAAGAAAAELTRQATVALAAHASTITEAAEAVAVARAALGENEAAAATHGEQVRAREAQLEVARITLGYATVASPAAGRVTRRAVEAGDHVQVGEPLLAVVSLERPTIVANYKETQVRGIRPGQRVRLRVDALPGRSFTGRVESIMAGTGAAFALFPPENASGNFVKVVQRIPVRIAVDPGQGAEELLRVGMSVVPTVLAGE